MSKPNPFDRPVVKAADGLLEIGPSTTPVRPYSQSRRDRMPLAELLAWMLRFHARHGDRMADELARGTSVEQAQAVGNTYLRRIAAVVEYTQQRVWDVSKTTCVVELPDGKAVLVLYGDECSGTNMLAQMFGLDPQTGPGSIRFIPIDRFIPLKEKA